MILEILHCRIGSLEISDPLNAPSVDLHCRIGSLETLKFLITTMPILHCRIGSLETNISSGNLSNGASLPNRQLRNFSPIFLVNSASSLPNRQLRNFGLMKNLVKGSSLPNRQLRNIQNIAQMFFLHFTAE